MIDSKLPDQASFRFHILITIWLGGFVPQTIMKDLPKIIPTTP